MASDLNSIADITSKLTSFLGDQSQQTNRPKAYVNWILFDENFRPVIGSGNTNSGFDAVGDNGGRKAHTRSTGAITKNGYLYVYCSNESKSRQRSCTGCSLITCRWCIRGEPYWKKRIIIRLGLPWRG